MSREKYLKATRHPWPCLLFLLPLLAAYEGGIIWLGGTHPEAFRSGADTWLRWGLQAFGLSQLYWTPLLVALVFLVWSWLRWHDRPGDLLGVCTAMAIESMLFAAGLLGLSRVLNPVLDSLGIVLASQGPTERVLGQVITFVGAGIYEEVLFRLFLYAGMVRLFRQIELPSWIAYGVAAATSALLFSAAHHAGPFGEAFDAYVFLFRSLAGLYFTFLFQVRGFGVVVGAHTCYDVLAGILING
jgi:membrane protease YdiL (CAAX protease family)